MNLTVKFILIAVAGGIACGAASADSANVVKLAVARYDTHSSTNGITGAGVPPGADARTGDASTLVFAYERTLSPNLAVELVAGVPPKISVAATGSIAALGSDVLSARPITATLLLNYHFGWAVSLRPYVGARVNHTHFTDVRSRLRGAAHLSDTTGLALLSGVHYAITRQWGAFASVVHVDSKTRLTTDGAPALSSTIDLKPRVYAAGLTYAF